MDIVAKFGGSCMTAENIDKVLEVIKSNQHLRYVVVSAPGKAANTQTKVTDLLIEYHRTNSKEVLDKVIHAFVKIEKKLDISCGIEKLIRRTFAHKRSYYYTISRGEYFSAYMLSKILGWDFVDTAHLVKFDFSGSLDLGLTRKLLSKALSKCSKAVIPGFYGSNAFNRIITFSRGGSDITGSLVADAVDAVLYENWTDVDGFLTANPSKVFNPRPIECISYSQLSRLNRIGADVLHPFTVLPLLRKCIPLHIRNIYNTSSTGTLVTQMSNNHGLLAITSFDTNYFEFDRPIDTDLFTDARFLAKDTTTRVVCQTPPKQDLRPAVYAKAQYIQAVYYGKADLSKIIRSLNRVYYASKSDNIFSIVIAPQKDAVQKVYDIFS